MTRAYDIAPSYHDSATWISEGTIGAWTLVVGYFPDHGSYCVDFYNRSNGARTRHYHATKTEAFAEVASWTKEEK